MNEGGYKKRGRNRHIVRRRQTIKRICCGRAYEGPHDRRYVLHMKVKHPGQTIDRTTDAIPLVAGKDITPSTLLTHLSSLK